MHIKRKEERGITLIALVITIVILIILATISITLVFGEGGLIDRAQEGKQLTEQAQTDEQEELKGAEEYINGVLAGTTLPKPEEKSEVEEARDSGKTFDNTTTITDDLDNPVTIPGGFHLDKDSGTKVEEGIVIEDDSGNQFVWIPVGEYNVTEEVEKITEPDLQDGKLTNELARRTFTSTSSTPVSGDEVIDSYYCGEGNENSVAKDQIDAFKTSSTTNKGFYIGRYEAGTEEERTSEDNPLTIPLVQATKYPYVYVTRDEAKQQAEAMYSGDKYVTSELISSYAWDTVLNFICQTSKEGYLLATTTDSSYGNIETGKKQKTGEYKKDNYANIYDLLGNCLEWTTEYSNLSDVNSTYPCVHRGSDYDYNEFYAGSRNGTYVASYYDYYIAFRLQLYINPES